jgi:hypothetical protein
MEFLEKLYGSLEGDYLTVYGEATGPFTLLSPDEFDNLDVEGEKDIYFRVCPIKDKPPSKNQRGDMSYTYALPCVWLDVDCGDHDSKKNYFPDQGGGKRMDREHRSIHYVGGFRAWLARLLCPRGSIVLRGEEDLRTAYDLSQRFQRWCKDQCPCELDSTHDLARVLRLPETHHSGAQSLVSIARIQNFRISQDKIRSLPISKQLSLPPMKQSSEAADSQGFQLSPSATVDQQQLLQLSMINPDFAATWTGQRALPGDQSPSAMRFSMISFLSNMGLDRQTIVDLTVRFLLDQKKLTPEEAKMHRPELWLRELKKCEIDRYKLEDIEEIAECDDRAKQLEVVATLMEMPDPSCLLDVHRQKIATGGDTSGMEIKLKMLDRLGGEQMVPLPDITSRAKCVGAIFERTGRMLPTYSAKNATVPNKKWMQAAELMWQIAVVLDPIESDSAAQLLSALREHILSNTQATSLEEARETGNVYLDGDSYVVPTRVFNPMAGMVNPTLKSGREMAYAVRSLEHVGVQKVQQMYRGVRMACLLVPEKLISS